MVGLEAPTRMLFVLVVLLLGRSRFLVAPTRLFSARVRLSGRSVKP